MSLKTSDTIKKHGLESALTRKGKDGFYSLVYAPLSQLVEENGSNPFQFRFESEREYHMGL